jgi:hypothetical protein
MNAILQMLSRGVEQLLGRASGPLHLRLVTTPAVVIFLAVRAGLRDAREGKSMFFWGILTHPTERPQLLRSALKDIGKASIVALVLDAVYQVWLFRAFYIVQALIVVVVCAILPYLLIRGPISVLTHGLYRKQAEPDGGSVAPTTSAGQRPDAAGQGS